jgi:predicted DNA-binding transcriptional regulator YafY
VDNKSQQLNEKDTMSNESVMQWGMERRIDFIEYLLYWDGKVNRKDITQFFGVSTPQASADIKRYQELAPQNIEYDKSKKYYFAPPTFEPKFIKPNAERYLEQLLSEQHNPESLLSIRNIDYATLPNIQRSIDADIVRQIVRATREGQAIEIKYQSFSQPNPSWRWIMPHALGFADKRWHCRSYCDNNHDFRDFVLSRILEIRHHKPSDVEVAQDYEWHTEVALILSPNSYLSPEQQEAIARDYGMNKGKLQVKMKAALLHYFMQEYNLNSEVPLEKQELVLVNKEQVKAIQQRLRPESTTA